MAGWFWSYNLSVFVWSWFLFWSYNLSVLLVVEDVGLSYTKIFDTMCVDKLGVGIWS
jgi:hypothetical protein